jgi:hypothetical protein
LEGVLLLNGFEMALIGTYERLGVQIALYDKDKCINILMSDMSESEALEYFNYNIEKAYYGDRTPKFISLVE